MNSIYCKDLHLFLINNILKIFTLNAFFEYPSKVNLFRFEGILVISIAIQIIQLVIYTNSINTVYINFQLFGGYLKCVCCVQLKGLLKDNG